MSAPTSLGITRNTGKAPYSALRASSCQADEVRGFGTWFYQRKCELLDFEIGRSEKHPALLGEEGVQPLHSDQREPLSRVTQVHQPVFKQDQGTRRLRTSCGNTKRRTPPETHDPNRLYESVLIEVIKRIDQFCAEDCDPPGNFVLILDEHTPAPSACRPGRSEHVQKERRAPSPDRATLPCREP